MDDPLRAIVVAQFDSIFGQHSALPPQTKEFVILMGEFFRNSCRQQTELLRAERGDSTINLQFAWFEEQGQLARPAYSERIGEGFRMRVNWRFIVSLHFLAHRLFAQPSFSLNVFGGAIDDADHTLKALHPDLSGNLVTFIQSRDPARLIVADNLAMSAVRFICLHELSHVSGGYFDYSERLKQDATLSVEDLKLSLQALEADADRQALLHGVDHDLEQGWMHRALAATAPEDLGRAVYESAYATKRCICEWTGFVVAILMSFPEVEWDESKIVMKTHPPNLVRTILIFRQLCDVAYAGEPPERRGALNAAFNTRVFLQAKAAIGIMTGESVEFVPDGVSIEAVLSRARDILQRQFEIAPMLPETDIGRKACRPIDRFPPGRKPT